MALYMGLFLLACSKEKKGPELQAPEIGIVEQNIASVTETLCGSPYDNVIKVSTGRYLEFKVRATAGSGLSQLKWDLHNNFDCHEHGGRPASQPWSLLKVVDLQGTDTTLTVRLDVPSDAAVGNYHLMFQLLDQEGREAPFVEFNLIVQNLDDPEPPTIALEGMGDGLVLHVGEVLAVRARIEDNASLRNGRAELTYKDAQGQSFSAFKVYFPDEAIKSYDLQKDYIIPSLPAKGLATFTLAAFDEANNKTEVTFKVNIQ